jgi:hypothetical protein
MEIDYTESMHIYIFLRMVTKYSIKTEPEQIYINSNKSSLKNKDFVTSEMTNLLNKGCIK